MVACGGRAISVFAQNGVDGIKVVQCSWPVFRRGGLMKQMFSVRTNLMKFQVHVFAP
jgi:hypothetical protein